MTRAQICNTSDFPRRPLHNGRIKTVQHALIASLTPVSQFGVGYETADKIGNGDDLIRTSFDPE